MPLLGNFRFVKLALNATKNEWLLTLPPLPEVISRDAYGIVPAFFEHSRSLVLCPSRPPVVSNPDSCD